MIKILVKNVNETGTEMVQNFGKFGKKRKFKPDTRVLQHKQTF